MRDKDWKNENKIYKIFISHEWREKLAVHYRIRSPYNNIVQMLNSEKGFHWQNLSISKNNPVPGPYRVEKVKEEVRERILDCDIYIVLEAGVALADKLWFQRELEIVLENYKKHKPILIVKPRGAMFWSSMYTSVADAWAAWSKTSIIQGIRSLENLTPAHREQLKAKGKRCANCQDGVPVLELNRLKGVYCDNCGEVTYLLSGQKSNQVWPDRSKIFWPNDSKHKAWSVTPSARLKKEKLYYLKNSKAP